MGVAKVAVLAIVGFLTTAVSAELICTFERQIECGVANCTCYGSQMFCRVPEEVICGNGSFCGLTSCECNGCHGGPACNDIINKEAPKFSAESYSIHLFADGLSPPMISAEDGDASTCNPRSSDACPCAEVRYRLEDNIDGIFGIDELSGRIKLISTKKDLESTYTLKVTAYNPIEGSDQETTVPVNVAIPSSAEALVGDADNSIGKWSLADTLSGTAGKDKALPSQAQTSAIANLTAPHSVVQEAALPQFSNDSHHENKEEAPTADESGSRQASSKARVVRSMTISSSGVQFNTGHTRVKRSHVGTGIPDEYDFLLEALSPHNTNPAYFTVGSVISYRLTISGTNVETDVKIEIFSEVLGSPYFAISNVRYGNIGGNFATFQTAQRTPVYRSSLKDGRPEYASVDLGYLFNNAADLVTAAASKMEILFEAQALRHPNFTAGNVYSISVGSTYLGEAYVNIAKDDLTYKAFALTNTPVEATFSASGPSTLVMGTTGIWTVTASISDLYSRVALDVFAPIDVPDVMKIDNIAIKSVGDFYLNYAFIKDDSFNLTWATVTGYGDYARLDLGEVINSGYTANNPNNNVTRNMITFEVAVTMLSPSTINLTSPYKLGFTVWRQDATNLELMWSAQQSVQAVNATLPDLTTAPVFSLTPSTTELVVGGSMSLLLNVTIPAGSIASYSVEISLPTNSSKAIMSFERMRISRIGFNLQHLKVVSFGQPTTTSTDGTYNDYALWNLGQIMSTNQRSGAWDNTFQVEIAVTLLSNCQDFYADNSSIYMTVGVKHASSYYWTGQASVFADYTPSAFLASELPVVIARNAMGEDSLLYPDSPTVYFVDIFVPAGSTFGPVTVDASTTVLNSSITQLSVLSVDIVSSGAALFYSLNGTVLSGVGDLDYANNPLNSRGVLTFNRLASMRDVDFDRYKSESTIRVKVVAIPRSESSKLLVSGQDYACQVTITYSSSYMYLARITNTFNKTWVKDLEQYNTNNWQPVMYEGISTGFSKYVHRGSVVKFDVSVSIPYRTVTELLVSAETSNLTSLQICQVNLKSFGSTMVNYVPYDYVGEVNYTSGLNLYRIDNYFSSVTSFGNDGLFLGDVSSSNLNFEVIVMFKSTTASNYTSHYMSNVAKVGDYRIFNNREEIIYSADKMAASTVLPVVDTGHIGGTDKINIGGEEVMYVDILIPPGTSYYLTLTAYFPWNSTFYGSYEIVSAYIYSTGNNVPCLSPATVTAVLSASPNSSRPNYHTMTLGYVPNLASSGTLNTMDNKVRILYVVRVPDNTTCQIGDLIQFGASLNVDGTQIVAISKELTVISKIDSTNDVAGVPFLTLKANGSKVMEVSQTQTWALNVTVPAGAALNSFVLTIQSPVVNDAAYAKISGVTMVRAGINVETCWEPRLMIPLNTTQGQIYGQQLTFNLLRNTGVGNGNSFWKPTVLDDIMTFSFNVLLLDHINFNDHFKWNLSVSATYGTNTSATVAATTDTDVETRSYPNDNAVFAWDTYIVSKPSTVFRSSQISFGVDVALSSLSRRFPSAVTVNFRLPYFSRLDGYNYTGDNVSQQFFVGPSQNTQYGLQFVWTKMRFDDVGKVRFIATVDPNYGITPGLGYRFVTIPVDIIFSRENRSSPGTFDQLFTEMKVLTFEIYIPEGLDALGMQNGQISDCQITASSSASDNTPAMARFNVSTGWESVWRGPPYYQSEFIQVDLGYKAKFTAVTIQPANDATVSRILTFKIQYSREGIRWEDALDDALAIKTFTVTYTAPVTAASSTIVTFGNMTFVGRYIRIIPQTNNENRYRHKFRFELHGYPFPYSATPTNFSSVVCQNSTPALTYTDRQWLINPNTAEVYVCNLESPGGEPYCSASDDLGVSWIALDDAVMNIIAYESTNDRLYGISRDKQFYLRSDDHGGTWFSLSPDDFALENSTGVWTLAINLPFTEIIPGRNITDFYTNYGKILNASVTWGVSEYGIHMFPSNNASALASKSNADNRVALWGTLPWILT